MKTIKSILPFLVIVILFLGYSYYNYNKRAIAVDSVEGYMDKNNFKRIWNFREAHFNLFDWIIADKSQFYFVYVNADMIEKETNEEYWVQFSSWKDPQDVESLTNYTVKRQGDKFQITINDLFWLPLEKDSITVGEVNGTVFEIVDNWIKNGEYPSLLLSSFVTRILQRYFNLLFITQKFFQKNHVPLEEYDTTG